MLVTALVLFLRWYPMVRPGTAMIITAGDERRVLLQGGRFLGPGKHRVEALDMTERELTYSFEGRQVKLTLRPKESEADVLSIVRDLGLQTANDVGRLTSALEGRVRAAVEASEPSDLHAAVGRALPLFIVAGAHEVRAS